MTDRSVFATTATAVTILMTLATGCSDGFADSLTGTDGAVGDRRDPPGSSGPSGGGDVCTALDEVRQRAQEIGALIDERVDGLDDVSQADAEAAALDVLDGLADDLDTALDDVVDSYDRAAELADDELADEIRTLRDASQLLIDELLAFYRDVESVEELDQIDDFLLRDDIQQVTSDAASATIAINEFTRSRCGFDLD